MFRRMLWLAVPMVLSACASMSDFQTSDEPMDGRAYGGTFRGGMFDWSPSTDAGLRLMMDPQRYMDSGGSDPSWMLY